MLWTIVVILLILWLLGFGFHVAGGLIHILLVVALTAIIGFIGLGIMYMGSSWPLIGDWKRDNPKAANQVVVGLFFVIFASSVTALITFT